MIDRIRSWFSEARRRWLYGIVAVTVPLLATYNVVAPEHATVWLGLAQAILGVTAGVVAGVNATERWRAWMYGVATAASALLVVLNVLPDAAAPLLLAVVQAVLTPATSVVAFNNVPRTGDDPR